MCFDRLGNLYTTNFSFNDVTKFNIQGTPVANPWGDVPLDQLPQSCTTDSTGNVYIGEAGNQHRILKFKAAGIFEDAWSPPFTAGANWIDLAPDQCTMFYSDQTNTVRRYNLCTRTSLPSFATGSAGPCYSVMARSNGEVLVSCADQVVRLDSAGHVVSTYPHSRYSSDSANTFIPATLDPDGTSFWVSDGRRDFLYLYATVYRINIATGNLISSFNVTESTNANGGQPWGLAVYGEFPVPLPTATATPTTPPTATATPTTPPTNTPTATPGSVPVVWTNAVNVQINGNTITKNGGTDGTFDAQARSVQVIPLDLVGHTTDVTISVLVDSITQTRKFGFNVVEGSASADVVYGLEEDSSGNWWTFNSGFVHYINTTVGDRLGIRLYYLGSKLMVEWQLNGTTQVSTTAANLSDASAVAIYASIATMGGTIADANILGLPSPTPTSTPAWTSTATPTPTAQTTPTTCPTRTYTGAITTSDPTQLNRFVRDWAPSACGTTKPVPDTADNNPTARHVDTYTFNNPTGSAQCIIIRLDSACTGTHDIFSAAYLGSFNATNITQNYLGDVGNSPGQDNGTSSYAVTVPAGGTLVVTVYEVTPNNGCGAYTLNVSGCLLVGGTPTATLTPAGVASATSTGTPTRTATTAPTAIPTSTSTPTLTNTPAPTTTNTATVTATRTVTATPTPAGCATCGAYVADVAESCNANGTVHWTARVTNNDPSCSVVSPWQVDLQVQQNWGDYITVQTHTGGATSFPPDDTTLNGDMDVYTFPADTTGIQIHFKLTAASCIDAEGFSGGQDPCPVP